MAPLKNGIERSATGMNLQRNREEYEDDDGGFSDRRCNSGRICALSVKPSLKHKRQERNIHIETILATIEFPKVMYPVMDTTTYMEAAVPILEPITPTMLDGELSLISFIIENI